MNNEFSLAEIEGVIREVIESGGEFELYPRGTSMLPLIREGRDSVMLVAPPEELSVCDIAFYKRDSGKFVLHRVVGAKDGLYTMCGDNQTWLEEGIRRDQIIAVVSSMKLDGKKVTPDDGKYQKWLKKWMNMPYRKFRLKIAAGLRKLGLKK